MTFQPQFLQVPDFSFDLWIEREHVLFYHFDLQTRKLFKTIDNPKTWLHPKYGGEEGEQLHGSFNGMNKVF